MTSKISLKLVTRRNLNDILKLEVKPEQKELVASNAKSIAQASFYRYAWFRAIYLDTRPIGFVMIVDQALQYKKINLKKPVYYLWRLMIDAEHQGKGYGRKALELLFEYVKQRPNAKEILTSHSQKDGNAGTFYEKLGFKPTGKIIDDEREMILLL